ncbi:hypothetical protein Peur_012705 [Populus x canadensis]
MSMIYLGIPEENVLEKHIEGIQRFCGSNAKVNSLSSQYVQKLGMIIKRSTHELDLDDQASIKMALQIPDSFTVDDKDHLFAKISSQKDSNLAHIVPRLSRLR